MSTRHRSVTQSETSNASSTFSSDQTAAQQQRGSRSAAAAGSRPEVVELQQSHQSAESTVFMTSIRTGKWGWLREQNGGSGGRGGVLTLGVYDLVVDGHGAIAWASAPAAAFACRADHLEYVCSRRRLSARVPGES